MCIVFVCYCVTYFCVFMWPLAEGRYRNFNNNNNPVYNEIQSTSKTQCYCSNLWVITTPHQLLAIGLEKEILLCFHLKENSWGRATRSLAGGSSRTEVVPSKRCCLVVWSWWRHHEQGQPCHLIGPSSSLAGYYSFIVCLPLDPSFSICCMWKLLCVSPSLSSSSPFSWAQQIPGVS